MPLIHYQRYITYPDGHAAANVTLPVWLLGGNILVPLFADKAGTTQVSNPAETDGDGLISVYAAPGVLMTELASQIFLFLVDPAEPDDAWPGTFVHEQDTPAAVWTVEHHFGVEPSVDIVIGGAPVEATVDHPDSSTTTLTFSSAQSGTAYLRR